MSTYRRVTAGVLAAKRQRRQPCYRDRLGTSAGDHQPESQETVAWQPWAVKPFDRIHSVRI